MKHFTLLVEFPDNLTDVDVLYAMWRNLPVANLKKIGIDIRTDPVLTEQFRAYLNEIYVTNIKPISKAKS